MGAADYACAVSRLSPLRRAKQVTARWKRIGTSVRMRCDLYQPSIAKVSCGFSID